MIKQLFLTVGVAFSFGLKAQTFITDFESNALPDYHNTVYNDSTNVAGGFQSGHAFFHTQWFNSTFGGYYSGWAASAHYDSTTAGYTNLYGCMAYKGYNNSNVYAIGTGYGALTIRLTDSLIGKKVTGMYITNSTYAYTSMRDGDFVAKKFGDTTGTGCNCAQGTYPDWFKLTAKRYYGGVLQNDSAELYLADFRFSNSAQDYLLKTWTWLNLSNLGNVDSLAFFLHSSDNGSFGMNTPAFFCIDDLTLSMITGIQNVIAESGLSVYPNPASSEVVINFNTSQAAYVKMRIVDVTGREMFTQNMNSFAGENKLRVDVSEFPAGVYYVIINAGENTVTQKLIKQ